MDKDDFKAIAVSTVIAPAVVFAFWWTINFVAYVADGSAVPMWNGFNKWVVSVFC